MRILRVAQKVYPEHPGGGPYHVHAMSRDQAAMGHDVTVLTVSDDDSLPRREERNGYTLIRKSPTIELLENEMSFGVGQYLRIASDFDVIHAHSHLYFSTNLTAIQRRLGDTPLAITNHGLYSQSAPKWLFEFYLHTAGRWTFNQADVVFCYTKEDRERVRDFGVNSPVEVVWNGVDIGRFNPNKNGSSLIEHDGPVVLFVGRLVEGKRPQDAIKAVSQLPEELNVKLYVVGNGPMRSELEAMADQSAEFIGQVSYDKMPAIYQCADALILPSRAEGLPRTILEAMASGIPTVATDLKQVAPVIGEGGKTVRVGNVDGFTTALKAVLDGDYEDPRPLVEEKFDWEDTVRSTTRVFEQLNSQS
ncbi:glycosyltransferase family 4 protein [Halosegnis rubeus]|uniref:Glycosyltransferase n=1 Tax=Halosegnis rubeus TaxID=2212850 RepID=A0A5N5UP21_9EURY|nr:glycosyltransferase family 4 protein [Halosegnis rubeus]KAB7519436.1 glycosyltransferase [Halosegnis rubeus]